MMQLWARVVCDAIANSTHRQQIPAESCSKLIAMPILIQLTAWIEETTTTKNGARESKVIRIYEVIAA